MASQNCAMPHSTTVILDFIVFNWCNACHFNVLLLGYIRYRISIVNMSHSSDGISERNCSQIKDNEIDMEIPFGPWPLRETNELMTDR